MWMMKNIFYQKIIIILIILPDNSIMNKQNVEKEEW